MKKEQAKKIFKEVVVKTTTIERAFITYEPDGKTIIEYDTRDLLDRVSVEELNTISCEKVDE